MSTKSLLLRLPPSELADTAIALFQEYGSAAYFGEAVSQTEHALQSAHLAVCEGASDTLIIAALLHDIGHLLHTQPEDSADQGIDTAHERIGAEWLAARFGPAVAEPGRLHVAAKRYLCATNPEYLRGLSPASVQSLALQGGPFNEAEQEAFERLPYSQEALRLRTWDDTAKVPGLVVPDIDHYRYLLEAVAKDFQKETA
jgi:phosphonate degradation associated HDIG domain protein